MSRAQLRAVVLLLAQYASFERCQFLFYSLGAAYPMAFKERVFQVLLTLNDKTAGYVDGVSLYATRDNFTNKTTLIVQNKGKDLLGVTTASYFAIGK